MNENKVCVDLIVPAIEKKYNVFIPVSKKTLELIYLLNKAVNEMSGNNFPIRNDLSLINAATGLIYDSENTVYANKILNGTKLILL